MTPPIVEAEALPAVFGRVDTSCGGGKAGEVSPYGLPTVGESFIIVVLEDLPVRVVDVLAACEGGLCKTGEVDADTRFGRRGESVAGVLVLKFVDGDLLAPARSGELFAICKGGGGGRLGAEL